MADLNVATMKAVINIVGMIQRSIIDRDRVAAVNFYLNVRHSRYCRSPRT